MSVNTVRGVRVAVSDFSFGKHALERILDMAIEPQEVRDCLESPESISKSQKIDNRELYFGDRITCVVQNGSVVTVLWRTKDAWKSDLAAGEYGGRSIRDE